jgi:hypothetical protein
VTTTTNKLAKHYSALTRDERFSLLVGAASRRDDTEVQRLLAAAKRPLYSVPDTFGPATAFLLTGLNHRAVVLEMATYLFATIALEVQRPSKQPRGKLHNVARIYGYLLKTRLAGWSHYCDRRGLVPNFLEDCLPGGDAVKMALKEADGTCFPAFSEKELREYSSAKGSEEFNPLTVERAAAELDDIHELGCGMFG